MEKKWLPLESNPEVFTSFSKNLGLDVNQHGFSDIYGLDPELLMIVPQPVLAVLMLFPITDASEKAKEAEEEKIVQEGQTVTPSLYYMKQTIGNACGTIGLLHAFGNNLDTLSLGEGTFLKRFFDETKSMTPDERAAFLEKPPEGAPAIDDAHEAAAKAGDTEAPSLEEVVNLHFVAFVCKDNTLYELDGRKKFPINHGPSSPDTLLQDSVNVVKKFMEQTASLSFNLIALTAA